jgi:predicted ATPase
MSTQGIGALERGDRRTPQRETLALLGQALRLDAEQRLVFEAAAARPGGVLRHGDGRASVIAGRAVDERPPLRPGNNLPLSLTSFVGRETEIGDIIAFLRECRLVTLTGAGGIGKTRTALQAVTAISDSITGGVWLVEFAPLRDPSSLAATIARTLEVQETPNQPLLETLIAYLKKKAALLILDNCEHVIAEVAVVANALLRGCSELRILATSREPLRIVGERSYRLPSLAVPTVEATRELRADDADAYGAIALFVDRAQAVDHRFALADENAPIVAQICRRLDGIPLAIELAAARVTILPVKELSDKLNERFRILTSGDRTALPRHQTMRALIDWSYDLIEPPEQRLFERMSIFVGGCSLATAAAVCADDSADELGVLELLSSLVDKSLVVADLDVCEPRYRLLESSWEYAREKLETRGEREALAQRHARVYLALAERLEHVYYNVPNQAWFAQAGVELENWRVALNWALTARRDVLLGQRLVSALGPVWESFGLVEGLRWVGAALDLVDNLTSSAVVARLEYTEAHILLEYGRNREALPGLERAVVRFEDLPDPIATAWAQWALGFALLVLGQPKRAEGLLLRVLDTARRLEIPMLVGKAQLYIGAIRSDRGELVEGRACQLEARAIFEALGAERWLFYATRSLAELELRAGDAEAALRSLAGALAAARADGDLGVFGTAANHMSAYLIALARYDEAEIHARQALEFNRERNIYYEVAFALQHLAAVATLRPEHDTECHARERAQAARLLGFVDTRLAAIGLLRRPHAIRQEYDRVVDVLQETIGADEVARLMAAGAAMTEDQAIEEVRKR